MTTCDTLGTESVSLEMLQRYDRAIPRYTSYPTAPEWRALDPDAYIGQLTKLRQDTQPLSLYLHIPFCKSMCLYCGCSVVLNRRPENEERYVQYLLREIDLTADQLGSNPQPVTQVAFGGGTPTKLTCEQLTRIMEKLRERFAFDALGEYSMEVDPRTVMEDSGAKLAHLKDLGFNRVSFGVQDTDPKVQDAVRRRQSYESSLETYERARAMGFEGINLDLIYGLPFQTPATFVDTIDKVAAMRPDRIALFSYAKVPWLKPHQKAIPDDTLPSTEDKFRIYLEARRRLLGEGYIALGMDHFALRNDPLAQAYLKGTLHRNFQGYTLALAQDLIGFGVTAIGDCRGAYIQNVKELNDYYASLDAGVLPARRGIVLDHEDQLRRWVIHRMMCQYYIDKSAFKERYKADFDTYFSVEQPAIQKAVSDGLLENSPTELRATPTGRLFVRNIAVIFDAYLQKQGGVGRFSKGV